MSQVRSLSYNIEGVSAEARLHLPQKGNLGASPGVLIIPGFADTAVGPHNMHVLLARSLAEAGFAVLRFDYRGQGESEGSFADFTGLTGYRDCREALMQLVNQPEVDSQRIFVTGYSLGGYYASCLASEYDFIQGLALLAPVAFPSIFQNFFQEKHHTQFHEHGWTDWNGWNVGALFLQSVQNTPSINEMKLGCMEKTMVIHGTDDNEVPIAHGMEYAARGATIRLIEGGDHPFSSYRVQTDVEQQVCNWFLQLLND